MRLPILWLVGMGVGFFPVVFPATTLLDFIVFCGARPERQLVSVGRMLNESDLGVEITRVKFKIVWNGSRSGKQPDRRPDDAFALSLDVGSPIFEVKSCSPWFRLVARQEGRSAMYEVKDVKGAICECSPTVSGIRGDNT